MYNIRNDFFLKKRYFHVTCGGEIFRLLLFLLIFLQSKLVFDKKITKQTNTESRSFTPVLPCLCVPFTPEPPPSPNQTSIFSHLFLHLLLPCFFPAPIKLLLLRRDCLCSCPCLCVAAALFRRRTTSIRRRSEPGRDGKLHLRLCSLGIGRKSSENSIKADEELSSSLRFSVKLRRQARYQIEALHLYFNIPHSILLDHLI